MKISKLRDKLLLSAASVSIVVVLVALLTVSWVIRGQHLQRSDDVLEKAASVIDDRLSKDSGKLQEVSRQLARQKNLGVTIWYLEQYASSEIDRETLFNTYQQLTKDADKARRAASLYKVAIYDSAGKLVSFARLSRDGEQAGFIERSPVPVLQVATLKEGEEPNRDNLRTLQNVADPGFELTTGMLLQHPSVHYTVVDGMLAMESRTPIMGEVFDRASGTQKLKQLGLVVMQQKLDQSFVDRLAMLTDTHINIFTRQGFSVGSLGSYRTIDPGGTATHTAEQTIGEITVGDDGYYQRLMPVYADKSQVGTIAVLYSKDIAQKNIREMIAILGAIAAVSLLVVFSLAWYLANSIARPLTVLSRVFRDVASGERNTARHGDFIELETAKARQDELGDLTLSFIAMNDAVNQKIQEINEINASLEMKVEERTAALSAREQESRSLIDNSPDTIARYDRECRRIYANPALCALGEGGIAALQGKRPSEYPGGLPFENYEAKIKQVFATGAESQFELEWPSFRASLRYVHIRLIPERDASGAIASVLGIGRDISERKIAERALKASLHQLEEKELAKTRFLAAAGHDLRQPLTAANLFIDALKFTALTPDQGQIVQRLDQAMTNFNELLDALLNVSKLDAGAIKPEFTTISLGMIFTWIEDSFAPLASQKQLRFKLYFPLDKTLILRTDIGLLKSVLSNLISNAIKYTLQGSILVSARPRGGKVLFQIWDTGIGIAEDQIEHIFDEFYQVNNPQRDRTSGLGLGLAIVKRALVLLDGGVTCRSRPGYGSVFGFHLPVVSTPVVSTANGQLEDADISETLEFAANRSFVRGKHFVVVEDDVLVADALRKTLEMMGGEVTCFANAEHALQHPNIGNADCYIVDYMLPGEVDGISFLLGLREQQHKPVCAVMMSGNTSSSFIRQTERFDWPVLHKPVNMPRLIARLDEQYGRDV